MDKLTLKRLLKKHAHQNLSEQETLQLREFLDTEKGKLLLSELWDQDFEAEPLPENIHAQEELWHRIENDERIKPYPSRKSGISITIRRVAAIVVLMLSIGALYKYFLKPTETALPLAQIEDILPGSDRARIVFDDGSFVELEAIEQDTLLAEKGIIVYKDDNGAVGYKLENGNSNRADVLTSVITPKGGEHKILLPDGSQVWLNAASTLRYPLAFATDSREVTLEGEGYFEVKPQVKNGKSVPFVVLTGQQRLEVLGTSFNINSYSPEITTTLVEGAVVLRFPQASDGTYLQPHQQSTYDTQRGNCIVKTVDPYFATAWRQGSFAFENASIYTVMQDIARWYDIDVEYSGDLSDIRYTGTISRFENFKQLLQIIEWTDLVTFSVEGRRVRVMR